MCWLITHFDYVGFCSQMWNGIVCVILRATVRNHKIRESLVESNCHGVMTGSATAELRENTSLYGLPQLKYKILLPLSPSTLALLICSFYFPWYQQQPDSFINWVLWPHETTSSSNFSNLKTYPVISNPVTVTNGLCCESPPRNEKGPSDKCFKMFSASCLIMSDDKSSRQKQVNLFTRTYCWQPRKTLWCNKL